MKAWLDEAYAMSVYNLTSSQQGRLLLRKDRPGFADYDPLTNDPIIKKREKRAYLWALDYMEKMMNRALARGEADSINYKAIVNDIEKAADKFYPNDEELNSWFVQFAGDEIRSLAREGQYYLSSHVFPEDGLKEWREELEIGVIS
jgi:hypothetical protein